MRKLALLFAFLWNINFVLATTIPPVSSGGILPGIETKEMQDRNSSGRDYVVNKLIPGLSNQMVAMILAIGVVMLIIAGYYYVFSSGDSEMKTKAKDIILWTVLGAVIAILSYAIVQFIIGINLEKI